MSAMNINTEAVKSVFAADIAQRIDEVHHYAHLEGMTTSAFSTHGGSTKAQLAGRLFALVTNPRKMRRMPYFLDAGSGIGNICLAVALSYSAI